ncbi:glycosyltransferase [Teichococcus cervicalis]|uniref:Glycosyltransferase, group 2 family protein n=1 Tax=Pseudoroseomonas cervicalis ATCC 49957 TaxID=525371 RepID=D5RHV5_9PROT|nr:glycosyltransferase [Pseudoroseomonas cervicalis]EFH13114.1 glycosyltransferase, group 2 family protein [Pseudoroseomonas cervicalis ATCC 49957]
MARAPREIPTETLLLVTRSGLFDPAHYRLQCPPGALEGQDPVAHYLREGWQQGLDPSQGFATRFYLERNPDVASSGANPLLHYLQAGREEGRAALPPERERLLAAADCIDPPRAPTPAEWAALEATWTPDPRPPVLDVIVPVYAGFDETMRCLYSVLAAPQRTPFRLLVVDDHGPEPALRAALRDLAARGLIELHATPQNLGFVGACNLGMALHPERDVLLLNSDTEVHNDWLDRMHAAARRRPDTGTVTPFSNNAEIFSYPRANRDNWLRLGLDDAALDRLAAEANPGGEAEVPTGVGFCMYVRRDCLDRIGLLDEANFGKGYGEENDLCRRAAAAGWRNILAADVFVRHHGAASFGASKAARVEAAVRKVEELHPGYGQLVSDFITANPMQGYREALDLARMGARAGGGGVLMVTHDWGGGTERHVRDLSALLEAEGIPAFTLRPAPDSPGLLKLDDPLGREMVNLRPYSVARDLPRFAEALRRLKLRLVHIHHLAGMPEAAADFLRLACARAGLAYDVTLHDYMAACPRITMIDRGGVYCGEPALESCERCIARDGSPFGHPSVWEWRERFGRLLRGARRRYVPDADVAERLGRHFPGLGFTLRPHPEPALPERPATATAPAPGAARHVVVIGAIGPHKGSVLLQELATRAQRRALPLRFTILGYTDRDDALRAIGNVAITGAYEEAELPQRLAELAPDLAFFPAVWPETYSYTLSAALAGKVYPVAFGLGAIATRLRALGWGELLPMTAMLRPDTVLDALLDCQPRPLPEEGRARVAEGLAYPGLLGRYYGLEAEQEA